MPSGEEIRARRAEMSEQLRVARGEHDRILTAATQSILDANEKLRILEEEQRAERIRHMEECKHENYVPEKEPAGIAVRVLSRCWPTCPDCLAEMTTFDQASQTLR